MPNFPKEIHDFVVRHFDSVEAIEIMILLQRSANTFWGVAAVSQRLGIPEEVVARKLAVLKQNGLLLAAEQSTAYRFAPADSEDVRLANDLANLYNDRRIGVINIVYSVNLQKLRAFSNAFKLKGQ